MTLRTTEERGSKRENYQRSKSEMKRRENAGSGEAGGWKGDIGLDRVRGEDDAQASPAILLSFRVTTSPPNWPFEFGSQKGVAMVEDDVCELDGVSSSAGTSASVYVRSVGWWTDAGGGLVGLEAEGDDDARTRGGGPETGDFPSSEACRASAGLSTAWVPCA